MKVFIIDDEMLARDELRYILEQNDRIEVVGDAEDVQHLMEEEALGSIDCLFLDIELQNENGMELAKAISNRPDCPMLVFATAYDDYALQAFEVNAVDYILKPFDDVRIAQTVDKLLDRHEKKKKQELEQFEPIQKIAVTSEDRIALVKLEDVLYFTSEESKTIAVTEKKNYVVSDSLVTLEKRLRAQGFMRVHRAFLINKEHLQELEPWGTSKYNVILNGDLSVPVSRMYVKEVRKIFDL